ncbi:MAG TPA: DUF2207 domain-containing protein [Thermodesulfobacteriota bacterium]|nr:DUF2207 domain-containing protein [Thermodesulfobacteriota bacterium]
MKSDAISFRLTILLILTLNLIFLISLASAQDFTINHFHSDIMIQGDSSVIVKETIDVMFHRSRHGIYRELPFRYKDELGKMITTPTRILSVADASGKDWKYRVEKSGPVIHVRIGDAKRYVDGNQTYVITYEVENVVLFLKDYDELYWNVTGNYWKAPIKEASATVFLTTKNKSKNLMAAGNEGGYGSEEECGYETYGELGKFYTKRNLKAGEGLTIAFGWDKALVLPPSSWKKFLWVIDLRENWIFLLPIFSFLFMFVLWYQKGRDPKVRESVAVMYEPPKFDNKPLTAGEVGTLIDEKLDPRDITSTMVGLAVKGYITIEETKKEGLIFDSRDYYLKRVKGPDEDLTPFEKELMEDLIPTYQPGTLVSELKNKFYTNIPRLKKMIYEDLVDKKYFLSSPEKVRNSYMTGAFILAVFLIVVLMILVTQAGVKNFAAGILTGIPVLAFGRVMSARTRAGASTRMDILGFREFMNRAEKDRLERMGDKNLFAKFLPYAIALHVSDNWAKAFEGIYQEPPDWYVSPGGYRTFTPSAFTHSFSSVTSSLGSAMFSAPRGSGGGGGFGGGGFSGGGFGGGGGGSW